MTARCADGAQVSNHKGPTLPVMGLTELGSAAAIRAQAPVDYSDTHSRS